MPQHKQPNVLIATNCNKFMSSENEKKNTKKNMKEITATLINVNYK